MRYIPIEKTEQDMILARSVYDNTGRVLLSCGTVLTDEYIDKLYDRGLPGIYIEDKLAEDIEMKVQKHCAMVMWMQPWVWEGELWTRLYRIQELHWI